MTAIHQFLPALATRDAIGGHTLLVQQTLRGVGVTSDIYAGEVHREARGRARHYREFDGGRPGEPTYLLYHASIGCPVATFLAARPEPKLLDYHNMTPSRFFEGWQPEVAALLAMGRCQLADLSDSELALADSAFNARELQELGYLHTEVVPILLDLDAFGTTIDAAAFEALSRDKRGTDWLFVGRVAPNKAQHDLVKAFAVYRHVYDAHAKLHMVGGTSSPVYSATLVHYVESLGVADAVEFAGSVSDGVLNAQYRNADVFVCLSEHEGFCVPLLEAMRHGVPIVGYGAAAVAETLGNAGVVLDVKTPGVVAAAVNRVVSTPGLRESIVAAGTRRLDDFSLGATRKRLLEAVAPLLDEVVSV